MIGRNTSSGEDRVITNTNDFRRCVMKRKYLTIVTTLLLLFMVFIQPGYSDADSGAFIDSETRDRLAEQYGLDQPVISNWSEGDVGISNPDHLFVTVGEVLVNPFVFMIRNFIHYLIY